MTKEIRSLVVSGSEAAREALGQGVRDGWVEGWYGQYIPKRPMEASLVVASSETLDGGDSVGKLGIAVATYMAAVYTTELLPGLYLHEVEMRPGKFVVNASRKGSVSVEARW